MSPIVPVLTALLALSTPAARAQCTKPKIPATGLPVRTIVDQPLTYSDGYKTLVNLTYPTSTLPACKWPLVVFVHGYGGRRSFQNAIASRGFAVASYDVRGQGTAKTLNPKTKGLTWYGPVEKYDLAELVAFARTKFASLVSPSKLAVTGSSQGGIHSWFAAAYSGRKITVTGRGTITFPRVDVAAPQSFIPDVADHALRDSTLFTIDAIQRVYSLSSAVLDPAYATLFKKHWLAQDPTGLAKVLAAEPGRAVAPLLPTLTVPTLYAHAWLDGIQSPRAAMPQLASIPKSTPFQAILSTIGHGAPGNAYETALRGEERIRWFDRFLWGIQNRAGTEARFVHGVLPAYRTVLANRYALWSHRHDAAWPASDVVPARYYTSAAGKLVRTPPVAGTPTVLHHRVNASYTPAVFVASPLQRTRLTILKNVPLSERVFSLTPLAADAELGGSPKVSLALVPSAARFTVCALLMARVPAQTGRVMLASWARGVLGAKPNVPMRLSFELSPAVYALPKGTVLELVLRNHWLREAPMTQKIVTAPYFLSSDTRIYHGSGAAASFVELPWRSRPRAALVTAMSSNVAARPGNLMLELRGPKTRAGKLYLCLASLSGQTPGIPLPGGTLPLNPDPTTSLFGALVGTPILPGFVGLLDASGIARPGVMFRSFGALPASLVGQRGTFAAWVFDAPTGLAGSPTNPVDVVFR